MSVARYVDAVSMGSSDVAIRNNDEDDGYTNKCLEINEFSVAATNRELVNLENAAVNIDNSSDVIIGPVTQFNVNGNVTIYQNKDGLPIGIEQIDEDIGNNCEKSKAQPSADKSQKQDQDEVSYSPRRKFTLKFYLGISFSLLLIVIITIVLVIVLNSNNKVPTTTTSTVIPGSFGIVSLFPKENWNGRPAKHAIPMKTPVDFVVIKHTAGGICKNFEQCAKKMQTLQSQDFTLEMDDIYFSFAVGGDGNVYEGRGWNSKPEYLEQAIDVVMLGNFAVDSFTVPMINATKALLEFGVKQNKLTKDYRLVNHNQTEITLSPGINVIKKVETWPHYDPRNYLGIPLVRKAAKKSSKPSSVT